MVCVFRLSWNCGFVKPVFLLPVLQLKKYRIVVMEQKEHHIVHILFWMWEAFPSR